jgi:hypothetical protein
LIAPVALLSLLLIGMTLVSVCHHHATDSSEANCSICHLSHQPIDRPLVSDRLPALQPVGPNPEPFDYEFAPDPMDRRVPARAPPAL